MVALFYLLYAAGSRAATPNHPPGFVMPKPATTVSVWPGTPPNWVAGGRAESVVNERFRNVSVPQLFVYLPPNEKANGTAVLICAGGGYNGVAMCLHVENVVKMFTDR